MEEIYAQHFNKALENYHFQAEFSGDRDTAFIVLSNAAHHLYGWLFCIGDKTGSEAMAIVVNQLLNNEVPQPFNLEACV